MAEVLRSFLSLVRLGVGHPAGDLPETLDWDALEALANAQGLSAIVLDGAQALTDRGELAGGRAMDVQKKKMWIGAVIRNYEQKYADYRKRIGQLAAFYHRHGFELMVLKGYGLSLNYPVPSHRPYGDIDIWAFGRYKEADAVLSKELGIRVDDSHHHHTVFRFKGYTVENHYDFVNVHYGHRNADLEKIFKSLASDASWTADIDGERICLPAPDLNALFLLRHMMLHFASTELNVRQILDWGFFVEKYAARVDWKWLQEVLNQYHMADFAACMNAICTEDLGFDAALFPVLRADASLKDRILEDTLSPEFSEPEPARSGLFPRVAFKYRRWRANAWKQDLCYGDNRLWAFLVSAWSHLIKPSMI